MKLTKHLSQPIALQQNVMMMMIMMMMMMMKMMKMMMKKVMIIIMKKKMKKKMMIILEGAKEAELHASSRRFEACFDWKWRHHRKRI